MGRGQTLPGHSLFLPWDPGLPSSPEFPLFSYNNGVVMTSCRELDNNRSGLSAASAFAIATAGANEGTPNKEKYRRMSLASTGARGSPHGLQGQGTPGPQDPVPLAVQPWAVLTFSWEAPPYPQPPLEGAFTQSEACCPRSPGHPSSHLHALAQKWGPRGLWSGGAAWTSQQPLRRTGVQGWVQTAHWVASASSRTEEQPSSPRSGG